MLTHANLIIIVPYADVQSYIKTKIIELLTKKLSNDELLNYLKKVEDNAYLDYLEFDGANLKKQEIIELQNRFSQAGIDCVDLKFYHIKNIDQASNKVLNALLKFIEDAPTNTFAFFSTKDFNAVLPTIKSRCSIVYLPVNKEAFTPYYEQLKKVNTNNLPLELVFNDLVDLQTLIAKNEHLYLFELFDLITSKKIWEQIEQTREQFKNSSQLFIKYLINMLLQTPLRLDQQKLLLELNIKNQVATINKNTLFTILITSLN